MPVVNRNLNVFNISNKELKINFEKLAHNLRVVHNYMYNISNFFFIHRSIEYVKPILQVLNSAYEKYGHGAIPAGLVNTMRNVNAQQ